MTCYVKNLPEIFRKAGADPRSYENKKALDKAVREFLGMERAPCNEVWKVVKERLADPAKRRELEDGAAKLMIKFIVTG